jgi:hypothetical protein
MPDVVSTRPLLDKLGVRPGARVAIAGVEDPGFRRLLAERTDDVTILAASDSPRPETDLVFLAADTPDDLRRIGALRPSLVPNGAIWVVSRKGRAATLRDVEVMDAGRSFDMIDNKVVSFSDTHTTIRLVIPLALRPR